MDADLAEANEVHVTFNTLKVPPQQIVHLSCSHCEISLKTTSLEMMMACTESGHQFLCILSKMRFENCIELL